VCVCVLCYIACVCACVHFACVCALFCMFVCCSHSVMIDLVSHVVQGIPVILVTWLGKNVTQAPLKSSKVLISRWSVLRHFPSKCPVQLDPSQWNRSQSKREFYFCYTWCCLHDVISYFVPMFYSNMRVVASEVEYSTPDQFGILEL